MTTLLQEKTAGAKAQIKSLSPGKRVNLKETYNTLDAMISTIFIAYSS